MKNEATKSSISSEEDILVSNQDEIESVHAEFIRNQMVKLNTDREAELNITGSNQYSNSFSLPIDYIRRKMVNG